MSNYIEKVSETRFFFTDDDVFKLQSSVLDRTTEDNSWLQSHAVPSLARNLQTTNKRIIKAINELNTKLNQINTQFEDFGLLYDGLIGDTRIEPQLKTDLEKVQDCVIRALLKNYKKIHGDDLDNPIEITSFTTQEISGSINEAINQLQTRFITLEDKQNKVYDWIPNEDYHQYQLVLSDNILCRAKVNIFNSQIEPYDDQTNWDVLSSLNIVSKTERFVLTSDDISNKYILLEEEPVDHNDVFLYISGGTNQILGLDYIFDGYELQKLIWGGYRLENDLEVWDEMIVIYTYIKLN